MDINTSQLDATRWYAQLGCIEPFVSTNSSVIELIAELEALPSTPIARSRLAQLLLLLGFKASAYAKLDLASSDPLEQAMVRVVLAASYKYAWVQNEPLSIASIPKHDIAEHHILLLYARGLAHWGQWRWREAIPLLNLAVDAARRSMPQILWLVEPLLENAIAQASEEAPEQQELKLRQLIAKSLGPVQLVEAKEKLVKLLDVRGNYIEAHRVSRTIPGDRFEKGFKYIEAAAAGEFNAIDWDVLKKGDAMYLPVVQVIQALSLGDFNRVLECQPPPERTISGLSNDLVPDDRSPYHPRSLMTWNIAFAWAHLSINQIDHGMFYLNNANIPDTDWDMVYGKNILILTLFALDPVKGREFGNIAQIVADTQRLIEKKLYSETIMVRMTPRVTPYTAAILMAAPGGSPLLEPIARPLQAILSGRGLELTKILYSVTTSVYKYLIANENPSNTKPSTIRSMRAKLNALLKANGSPEIIKAGLVLDRLTLIAEEAKSMPTYGAWLAAADRYREQHLL